MGRRGRAGNKGGAFSCFACREKKVFCDKVQPCGRCALLGLECIMQTRGRGRPARPKQESGSEEDGLSSGGLQSMDALGMEGAGPAPAEGLALDALSEPEAMMDAEEEGGIISPPVVLMDMGGCDPSLSKPRCDGSSSSGEPGTSPPSPLCSSSSSSSSRSSSQSRPTSPSVSPLVHCSTITEEAVMNEGCGTEERQHAWQGGPEAQAGMGQAEEDAKRLVVAPATLTSTWQSAGPAGLGLSFKVDLPVGGLDELRLSYVVCCRRISELRNCGRFAMQKGDFVWRTIEFLFLSEGDVYSGWELLEVLCGSYAKPAIEQQQEDMARQVARAVMPGCSGGSSVSTGAAELAMLKGGGGRPAFGHWRLADGAGAGAGDGGDAWIAELMDTPSAACVHFCLARPDVLVEEQVRCNATMSSLFMSVDEICRASLQLHCVFPHVLAKVVRRESHQDFFGAMMDVSFVSEHIAHQDCIVQVCDRRGRIFSCLSTLRCRFSPMAVDLVIRFLPLPPSHASAATSSRPTRVPWPQVSTPAPPYAVAATDNHHHLLQQQQQQQQQTALNTRGIRTWHTAPPAAVLLERPPATAPPLPPLDGSTSYVFTWGTNHHARPQPPVPPPATSRPWPPAATYPSWQQQPQQAPALRLGGPLPMAPPSTLKPPIADTAAARALAAAALAAPPTSPFDAMSRSFMDLAS